MMCKVAETAGIPQEPCELKDNLKPITPIDISSLNPPLNVTRITDYAGLGKLSQYFDKVKAEKNGVLGWDIETTPLKDYFFRRCRTMQFGDHNEQYVIDLLPFFDNNPTDLFNRQGNYGKDLPTQAEWLVEALEPVICTKDYLKVGVSLGFEYMSHYWLFGKRTFNFYDCALAEKAIWAGAHSLKDYAFYSMNGMMERYFHQTVDKQYQESFTLDAELTDDQIAYAALDTRFPLPIRSVQQIITSGAKLNQLKGTAKYFSHLEPKVSGTGQPIIMGDKLAEVVQLENDAIGSFEDMHIHGERLDREKWKARIALSVAARAKLIAEELDPHFVPLVGSKNANIADADIEKAEQVWKAYNVVSDTELKLKASARAALKSGDSGAAAIMTAEMEGLAEKRKADKEIYKTSAGDMKKLRTKIKNLAAKCEGEALINYSSDAQLLAQLTAMKGLKNLKNLDDETLEKYSETHAVMKAIRKLHGYSKEIGTYGNQWATEWTTKPCKEEGWLNPGDGRLHCVFNQYDAETGRSSSEKPNGQNLPQDKEVRSCFIADPPDESIRISDCCDAETWDSVDYFCVKRCNKCNSPCQTHAEEYVIVTADMSGAELRIIAELAQDPVWIGAFNRGEDVHSVGTEILHEAGWSSVTAEGCLYYAPNTEEDVATNALRVLGDPRRWKCDCKMHKELRNDNKSTNFLLAYGGGPTTLAMAIKKSKEKATELMTLHSLKFPRIWDYLKKSGQSAAIFKRSFDMFGRRRLFPDPTYALARERVMTDKEAELRYAPEVITKNVELFKSNHNREPDEIESYVLSHREPADKDIKQQIGKMRGTIERQGKNHAIQGTNASIAKKAMGCGYDPDGIPYLWHTLPNYNAKLLKFVHDELVVQCPKRYGKIVADLIGSAFKRAAAERMKAVTMEFDYNIAAYWSK